MYYTQLALPVSSAVQPLIIPFPDFGDGIKQFINLVPRKAAVKTNIKNTWYQHQVSNNSSTWSREKLLYKPTSNTHLVPRKAIVQTNIKYTRYQQDTVNKRSQICCLFKPHLYPDVLNPQTQHKLRGQKIQQSCLLYTLTRLRTLKFQLSTFHFFIRNGSCFSI